METHDWKERLKERHLAPPPAPVGELQAMHGRLGRPGNRLMGPVWTFGGALALAGLAAILWLPGLRADRAAQSDREFAAVDRWVYQQWNGVQSGTKAEDRAEEPGSGLLAVLDAD